MNEQPLLFELGKPGRKAIDLPACDVPLAADLLPAKYLIIPRLQWIFKTEA